MWNAWVNISRSENKQSEVLRTDNQQLLHNFQQNARFNICYILNPSVCVHHCHYRRDLSEERYQLRPTFSAPCSRTRDQIAALCWVLHSELFQTAIKASLARETTNSAVFFIQTINSPVPHATHGRQNTSVKRLDYD